MLARGLQAYPSELKQFRYLVSYQRTSEAAIYPWEPDLKKQPNSLRSSFNRNRNRQ